MGYRYKLTDNGRVIGTYSTKAEAARAAKERLIEREGLPREYHSRAKASVRFKRGSDLGSVFSNIKSAQVGSRRRGANDPFDISGEFDF
jgi:hypothetical protein